MIQVPEDMKGRWEIRDDAMYGACLVAKMGDIGLVIHNGTREQCEYLLALHRANVQSTKHKAQAIT